MFSGIIEETGLVQYVHSLAHAYRIQIRRPKSFNDIKVGDSIAVDGVCLTIEAFDDNTMTFVLAAETLRVLKWHPEKWQTKRLNLERSLRVGDRVHGHFVSGHVDSLGKIEFKEHLGESLIFKISFQDSLAPLIWTKGSVAVNGVSLTVNEVTQNQFSICLIPETLKRTNLGDLNPDDFVNLEPDMMARAMMRNLELQNQKGK